jgi:hypothetical protein
MLKTLLAAGGGLTASFLPVQWLKPVVKAGELPLQAITSADHHVLVNSLFQLFLPNSIYIRPEVYVYDGSITVTDEAQSDADRGSTTILRPNTTGSTPVAGVLATLVSWSNYSGANDVSNPIPDDFGETRTSGADGWASWGNPYMGFTLSGSNYHFSLTYSVSGCGTVTAEYQGT